MAYHRPALMLNGTGQKYLLIYLTSSPLVLFPSWPQWEFQFGVSTPEIQCSAASPALHFLLPAFAQEHQITSNIPWKDLLVLSEVRTGPLGDYLARLVLKLQ